ncbi:MAG: serine protease [Acidimicrobiaceae bacterium]|nr:serine protease [Acidimicrobiaceae bacterium]
MITSENGTYWGTGFFLNAPHFKDPGKSTTWFVTCKHVYHDILKKGNVANIWINRGDGTRADPLKVPLGPGSSTLSAEHGEHDVVVISAGSFLDQAAAENFILEILPPDRPLTRQRAEEIGVSEGDGVFILGFPVGWEGSEFHYPVARYGTIAQIRGWFGGWHSTFLVDGSAFGGNSGSPVITKFEVGGIRGLPVVHETYLIGMVSQHRRNPTESMDLIVVVPMDHINATIRIANEAARAEYAELERALEQGDPDP